MDSVSVTAKVELETPRWSVFALVVQLALTLLAPPIRYGERSVFFGDLWGFLWVSLAFLHLLRHLDVSRSRPLLKRLLISAFVIGIVFVHGYFRPTLVGLLHSAGITDLKDDRFNGIREAVVAARFLSWIWAAQFVAFWFSGTHQNPTCRRTALKQIQTTLAMVVAVCALCMIGAHFSAGFRLQLETLYGYRFSASPWWTGREYGVFRSPIEGSLVFGLALPLLLVTPPGAPLPKWLRSPSMALSLVGLLLTGTLTPLVGWFATAALFVESSLNRFWKCVSLFIGAAALGLFLWFLKNSNQVLFAQKRGDLLYRLAPWKTYWNVGLGRWDYFILGLGFPEYHVDNSFIFMFNRGGLLLLGYAVFLVGRTIRGNWLEWDWSQRGAVVYTLCTGLALDTFIIRPVVAIWITAGMALLAQSTQQRKTPLSD